MNRSALIGLAGLGAGTVIGYVVATMLGKSAPESHSVIAKRVVVHDDSLNLTPKVDFAPIDAYDINGEVTSTWAVRYSNKNIAAYIVVYGPDSNNNHRIEISRRANNKLTIQYPNGTGMSTKVWEANVGEGYILAVVTG